VARDPDPRRHIVQFWNDEQFLHRAIAAFFTRDMAHADSLVMVSRPRTFKAVTAQLRASRHTAAKNAAGCIQFVNAEASVTELVNGEPFTREHLSRSIARLVEDVWPNSEEGTVKIYGEMVDVLCERGHHAAAVQVEKLWDSTAAQRPRASTLCGYAIERFDHDVDAVQLRAICRHHVQVIPAESIRDAVADRARGEEIVALQHRARALNRLAREASPPPHPHTDLGTLSTIYIIDDDGSVRRSLARLLESVGLRVRTYASAEEFLEDVDDTFKGCLLVDIQLGGMTGLDLQTRMALAHWPLPIIAMSGSMDVAVEIEALRLGAVAFLRKPFDAEVLLDAIQRAMT
jgi:CheY-like chemotaxis protein